MAVHARILTIARAHTIVVIVQMVIQVSIVKHVGLSFLHEIFYDFINFVLK